jgi:hypothetical protein
MKKLFFTIVICFMSGVLYAQVFDTIPRNGFEFPLKSKITLKLVAIDSVNYQYYIMSYKSFNKIIDTYENDKYLSKEVVDNTIELIFCVATHGKNKKEREANYQTLLLIKNGTKYPLTYRAKMKVGKSKSFESTSVVPLYPMVKNMEMWPYLIEKIALLEFKRMP